jgi:hypothetical protein
MDALLEGQIALAPGFVSETSSEEDDRDFPLRSARVVTIERYQGFMQLAIPWRGTSGYELAMETGIKQVSGKS